MCLIATQVDKGIVLCTYDREFRKFPFLMAMEPKEVVETMGKSSKME